MDDAIKNAVCALMRCFSMDGICYFLAVMLNGMMKVWLRNRMEGFDDQEWLNTVFCLLLHMRKPNINCLLHEADMENLNSNVMFLW